MATRNSRALNPDKPQRCLLERSPLVCDEHDSGTSFPFTTSTFDGRLTGEHPSRMRCRQSTDRTTNWRRKRGAARRRLTSPVHGLARQVLERALWRSKEITHGYGGRCRFNIGLIVAVALLPVATAGAHTYAHKECAQTTTQRPLLGHYWERRSCQLPHRSAGRQAGYPARQRVARRALPHSRFLPGQLQAREPACHLVGRRRVDGHGSDWRRTRHRCARGPTSAHAALAAPKGNSGRGKATGGLEDVVA
jgi:hypothetical protein